MQVNLYFHVGSDRQKLTHILGLTVCVLTNSHVLRRTSLLHGLAASRGRGEGKAPRLAKLKHHDTPYVFRLLRVLARR